MSEQFVKVPSKKKPKFLEETNSDNITLYLGASALFISVISSVFFYREIRNIKRELGDVKQIKNQMSNIDVRFDAIDNKFEEIIEKLKYTPPPIPIQNTNSSPKSIQKEESNPSILKLPNPQNNLEEVEESEDDSDVESIVLE